MAWSIDQLEARLREIKAQRKAGALDERAYYKALLELAVELSTSLLDELDANGGRIEERDIRTQTPLILAFVEDQIQRFRAREDARK